MLQSILIIIHVSPSGEVVQIHPPEQLRDKSGDMDDVSLAGLIDVRTGCSGYPSGSGCRKALVRVGFWA